MAVRCPECHYLNGAHRAWCSKNALHPTPPPTPYDKGKRHFKTRPDDGRTPKDKRKK